ncbi:MAG: carbon storage regulator [Pirellula sp.]
MLVLSRKIGERIRIGDEIFIEVREIFNNRVVLAVCAPDEVVIDRQEVHERREKKPDWKRGRRAPKGRGNRDGLKRVVREMDVRYAHRALCFESSEHPVEPLSSSV